MDVLPFFTLNDFELVQVMEPMSMFPYFILTNAEIAQNWTIPGSRDEYWLEKSLIFEFAKKNPGFLVHRPTPEVGFSVDISTILHQPSTNADSDCDQDYFDDEDFLYNPGVEYHLVDGKYKKTSAFIELKSDDLNYELEHPWAYDKLYK
jgi:hypothetical protein